MKPKTPAIALRRRQAALTAFRTKVEVLERLLAEGTLSQVPARASVAAFASWQDTELGLRSLSRSALYSDNEEYLVLRRRMEKLLERVAQRRAKGTRRENNDGILRQRLAEAEERAQSYVNDYSAVRAELLAVRSENERLREELQRLSGLASNVLPIRVVRSERRRLEGPKDHE